MDFDTATVIKRHLDALLSRDLDRLMEDYAEDAFFLSNMAPVAIRGRAALRAFWMQAFLVFTPEVLGSLKFTQQEIEGDVAFILWSAGPAIPFGSDTFVVRGGKIVAQTGAVLIAPRG